MNVDRRGRIGGMTLLACAVLLAGASASRAGDAYAGRWSGGAMRLALQPAGEGYRGTLRWRGKSLPIQGEREGRTVWGEVRDGDTAYSFLIERAGAQLRFTIQSKVHLLSADGQGAPAAPPPRAPQAGGEAAKPDAADRAGNMLLRRVAISDRGGWIGGDAGSLLAPEGWQVRTAVRWYLHPTMPGRIAVEAQSPDGRHRIAIHPHSTYFVGPGVANFQEGRSVYYGNTFLRPVGSAERLIRQIVLPSIRPAVRYRVLQSTPLPKFAGAIQAMNAQPPAVSRADARCLRIAHEQAGREIVEDVMAVYAVQQIGPVVYWQGQFVMTVTSDAANIDRIGRLHAAMVDSIRINPKWFNKYQQISDAFQQMAAANVQLAANQSRIIAQLSDRMTAIRRAAYENTQRSLDRVHRNFSEYVRGVETWQDPHGQSVQLPTGHDRAWQADDGTILMADQVGLNPNTDARFNQRNWRAMTRR